MASNALTRPLDDTLFRDLAEMVADECLPREERERAAARLGELVGEPGDESLEELAAFFRSLA